MRTAAAAAALACSASLPFVATSARAHVVVGARVFPVTLTFDDPGVGDEASFPAFTYQRGPADGGTGPTHDVDLGFEYDKTITPDTALILNDGYDINTTAGSKTETDFENLFITGKWQAIANATHEFVLSLSIIREIGGTGTTHTGADAFGSTSPTAYFGKGFGDLPIGVWRAFAMTGELSYTIADKELKQVQPPGPTQSASGLASPVDTSLPAQFNGWNNNAWAGSLSFQYSIPYLQSQVRDIGLSGFLANLIPLVELDWSSPASSPSSQGTTWTAAPGVIYLAGPWEFGLEALVPLNRTAGTNVGAGGLVHVFFDDLYPDSLGKPLFQ